MRSLWVSLLAVSLFVCLTGVARASVVDDLVMDVQNFLEDDDWEIAVDAGNSITDAPSTSLDVDDFLVGMIRMTALEAPEGTKIADYPTTGATFTGVFAVKVTGKSDVGGGLFNFSFTAATDAEWGTLGLKAVGFDPDPDLGNTAVIAYDDPDNIDETLADTGSDTSIDESIATVDGTKLWEFGFDTDPDLYWVATGLPDDLSLLEPQTSVGAVNLALELTKAHVSAPILLSKVEVSSFYDPNPATGDNLAHLVGIDGIRGAAASANDWQVKSDTDLYIYPVPEPGSLLVWGGLLAFVGFSYRRRRRR